VSEQFIAVIGVGYVGLPLVQALAEHHPRVLGFDTDAVRVAELNRGHDRNDTGGGVFELPESLSFSDRVEDMAGATCFIVTVPTPIDDAQRPDLSPLKSACHSIGAVISEGALVIFESTVYPGVTEENCGPWIAEVSGLVAGEGFKLGYSPERINPGDEVHTLRTVTKIVAGQDVETLVRVVAIYDPVVEVPLHQANSIKVAEAAKITENIQRDINIALMNELALIFDRLDIRSSEVLAAAGTKWNFHPYTPGLVGGHCIGVDPYYLLSRAESLGYYPELIRAGRKLNNAMAGHVARQCVQMLTQAGHELHGRRVGVLGVTFKENVADCRNSQVPEIVRELERFGLAPLVHDPHADPEMMRREFALDLVDWADLGDLDALVLAVPHTYYLQRPLEELLAFLPNGGVLVDIKATIDPAALPSRISYWSL
jgi:UDP-N-acetyl-D-galactosamine dehydrogenase